MTQARESWLRRQAHRALAASVALWLATAVTGLVVGGLGWWPRESAAGWFAVVLALAAVLLALGVVLDSAAELLRWRREPPR
jgi:hypothetical protein